MNVKTMQTGMKITLSVIQRRVVETARRCIPQGYHLDNRRCENINSHSWTDMFY